MKRLIALLLCLLFCLSISACGGSKSASDPQPQPQNEMAKVALTKVLNYEQSFSYTCMVFGETTEETLNKFQFSLPYQSLYAFVPKAYVFTDRDADEIEELLIYDARLFCMLTLDYNDGIVTGTVEDNFDSRDYQDLDWVNIE